MTHEDIRTAAPTTFSGSYLLAARGGLLLAQRCACCGRFNPYTVTLLCHHCGSTDLDEVRVTGDGVVLSETLVTRASIPGPARCVVLVQLDEGMRVLGIAPVGELQIGDRATFAQVESRGGALLFRAPPLVSEPTPAPRSTVRHNGGA